MEAGATYVSDVRNEHHISEVAVKSKTKTNKATGNSRRNTEDIDSVLRNLYTVGWLDAQQQGWNSLPAALFNTLTMQLGTLRKVRQPGCLEYGRRNLERYLYRQWGCDV